MTIQNVSQEKVNAQFILEQWMEILAGDSQETPDDLEAALENALQKLKDAFHPVTFRWSEDDGVIALGLPGKKETFLHSFGDHFVGNIEFMVKKDSEAGSIVIQIHGHGFGQHRTLILKGEVTEETVEIPMIPLMGQQKSRITFEYDPDNLVMVNGIPGHPEAELVIGAPETFGQITMVATKPQGRIDVNIVSEVFEPEAVTLVDGYGEIFIPTRLFDARVIRKCLRSFGTSSFSSK